MAEKQQTTEVKAVPEARRVSITQRLLGNSRDLFSGFYATHETEDQMYGVGFNDQADELIPAVIHNNAIRRRNSSVSSENSVEGLDLDRKSSITEKIAGLQLMRKPTDKFEGFATTISSCIDDQ